MPLDFCTFLNQSSLISKTVPSINEIFTDIKNCAQNKSLKVMYGETYDRYGIPLGSIKYYFTVAAIGSSIRAEGIPISPVILVADVATCRNESEDHHDELMQLGKARAANIHAISSIYGL